MTPLPRASRVLAMAAVVAAVAAMLSGCAPGPEHPAIEGTVTFKTIERPHLESCDPDDPGCGWDRTQEIATDYRVEITYPDDKPLVPHKEYPDDDFAGHECWFSVEPDEYAAVELGQKVLLGSPLNSEYSFNNYPTTCDLIDDLAPNDVTPSEEWTPGDEEFGRDPEDGTSQAPTSEAPTSEAPTSEAPASESPAPKEPSETSATQDGQQ